MSEAVAVDSTGTPLPSVGEARSRAGSKRSTVRRVLRQRSAIVGLTILLFLLITAMLADVIAQHPPNLAMIGIEDGVRARSAPCIHLLGCPESQPQHLLGTDGNVRDQFSRLVFGARISLLIGFVTVGGAILIGVVIGSIAGYLGGRVDNVLMRIMDMFLAFPALVLAIVIVSVLGRSLVNAMIAVSIVAIPIYARVMRSSVLSVREQDYVVAACALGDSPLSILVRRVMPNAITPLIVQATLGVGSAVLEIAALSFIGLTAIAPNAEWGSMIALERNQLFTSPHLVFIPGVAITLTVLGFNLFGDGLRDAFDPRLSR